MKFFLLIALILVAQIAGFITTFPKSKSTTSQILTKRNLFGNSEPAKNVPEKKNDGGMFGGKWTWGDIYIIYRLHFCAVFINRNASLTMERIRHGESHGFNEKGTGDREASRGR
jgi:hypothetical protein